MQKYKIADLIPHSGEMVLIDDVLEVNDEFVEVCANISSDNAFLEDFVFPTFKTLEMMAQSLVVLRGLDDKKSRYRLGFLLGARRFKIFKPFVEIGKTLIIHTKISIQDQNGLGVYESSVYCDNFLIAEASISVLNPNDELLEQILSQKEA